MKLGIQLFTVRDLTDDDAFKSTLSDLAELGFQGVEFAWKYGGMTPAELADFLNSLGLECCGLHVHLNELLDPDHEVYKYAAACASPFITTSLAGRVKEFPDLIADLDKVGEIANGKNIRFTYHNHFQELAETVRGVRGEDFLIDNANPENVHLEIDIGWVKKGGAEPMAYWRTHAARTPQIHLRDYSDQFEDKTDPGDGFIDFDAVAAQGRELGTEWLIYEQSKFLTSPMTSCAVCAERAKAAGVVPA